MKDNEQNSALFDTVLLNASGKLDIVVTNIGYISYQILDENSTAVLSCQNQNLSAALMSSGRFQPHMVLDVNYKNSNRATISVEQTSNIFLGFGAENGTLSIVGDHNISFPLINGYMGIMLNVSSSINRSYSATIRGNFSQIYFENWQSVKYTFLRSFAESNNFLAYSPNGSLSYNDKEFQAKGSQDLDFTHFSGVVYLTPSTDPYFFRILLNGDVASVITKTSYTSVNLTEKNILDRIFPFPISAVSFALFWILWKKYKKIKFGLLPAVVVFCVISLIWAIKTEEPLWVQNFFGYVPLFVTVITFLISTRNKQE